MTLGDRRSEHGAAWAGRRPCFGAQVEKWLTQIETYRHKVKDWQAVIVEQRTAGAVSHGG
eukprot:COSAG01_NODE_6678_length_3549_cov_23.615362_3_plen_60_part_00